MINNEVRGNVLIIEDDQDTADLCARILMRAGYGIRWVHSRDAALVALNRGLYQFILLDYSMPGLTIEEFLHHCLPKGNVVLMSGIVDPQKEARRLGISCYLKKPFDPAELIALIRGLASEMKKRL